ncbi:hypothetical protein [Desulfobacter postgatei]|uniref:hypothetical protein n=1 Tax=Desulfobacter postgatei TaxID=2293 RepID=UPI00259B4884|nr:hypothetical protein [uncultured Desulfobacter sp.]
MKKPIRILTAIAFICALAFTARLSHANDTVEAPAVESIVPISPYQGSLKERQRLTGDWAGCRTWLEEHGITLAPRLTQFYQGLSAGDGDHDFEYGGKADLMLNADLSKLGFWKYFSLTVHTEYNYGESVTGAGGTLVPPNTALVFPGMEDADAFDLSSVYFTQHFSKSVSLLFGKINMMDIAASTPFKGGAGIDSFWNLVVI